MGEAVYSGMKGAVIAFSKSLAREMARYKINVNVVCPGLTETPLMEEIRGTSEWSSRVMESITRTIPLRRLGQPSDIAAAVAFFASPAAEYITGQTQIQHASQQGGGSGVSIVAVQPESSPGAKHGQRSVRL